MPLPEVDPEPEPPEEKEEVKKEPPTIEKDDGGADAGMIVGIVLGLIVLIAIVVVGLLIWRKRRSKDTGQVSVKLANSKEMKSSFSKQTHIVKQDLGEEDEEVVASDNRAGVGQSGRELLTEEGCGQEKD